MEYILWNRLNVCFSDHLYFYPDEGLILSTIKKKETVNIRKTKKQDE